MKKKFLISLFFLIFSNKLYAANVAEDTTISSDATAQQVVTANDVDIIITDNASITRTATSPVEKYTDRLDIRIRARQISLKIESSNSGVIWQLGSPRLDIRADGRR